MCYNDNMLFFRIFQTYGLCREALLACIDAGLAIVIALCAHEFSHALVAKWNGDYTAKVAGRLTLNPKAHFDLFGLFLMLMLGFGYARPVPVNPNNYKNRRLGEITVSLAGVFTNMLLAAISSGFAALLTYSSTYYDQGTTPYYIVFFLWKLFVYTMTVNISFALFNILPIFPLDGFRFIAAFVGEDNRFMRGLRNASVYILLGIVVVDWVCGIVPVLEKYSPLYWYFTRFGGLIQRTFITMWRLPI